MRGLDKDDKERKVKEEKKKMKKIASTVLLGMLFFGGMEVQAGKLDYLSFSVGDLNFRLPFTQDADIIGLYDVIGKKGFVGAETSVVDWRGFQGTFGVATDADIWNGDINGNVFGGVRRHIGENLHVGIWCGRDFRENIYRAGVKASWEIFGPDTL